MKFPYENSVGILWKSYGNSLPTTTLMALHHLMGVTINIHERGIGGEEILEVKFELIMS